MHCEYVEFFTGFLSTPSPQTTAQKIFHLQLLTIEEYRDIITDDNYIR